ncbi:MAG: SRPBCC family protein [Flavobacterium sp.]|nr:SRPBCC family protein [Flavobacterium sp.]
MLPIIAIVIVGIIAIALVAAAIMDKKFTITSEVVINAPRNSVFNYIKLLKNQEHYSKWVMMDPNVKLTYTGTDGTVGFKSAWESKNKNVGVGEQEITKINEGDGYEVEIRFKKPFEGVSTAVTSTQAISNTQTKITNTFYSSNPFPMNLMIPMLKKMLKKDMDESAANLKKILETK